MDDFTDQEFFDAAYSALLDIGCEAEQDQYGMPDEQSQAAMGKITQLLKQGRSVIVKPSPFAGRKLLKMLWPERFEKALTPPRLPSRTFRENEDEKIDLIADIVGSLMNKGSQAIQYVHKSFISYLVKEMKIGKDKRGYRYCTDQGKRVKCPPLAKEPPKKKPKQEEQQPPANKPNKQTYQKKQRLSVQEATQLIEKVKKNGVTEESLASIVAPLTGMKVPDLKALHKLVTGGKPAPNKAKLIELIRNKLKEQTKEPEAKPEEGLEKISPPEKVEAKVGKTKFPPPQELSFVQSAGGSTGAKIYKDKQGNKYVVKANANPGHLADEMTADNAYRALGLSVPDSEEIEVGGKKHKIGAWVNGKSLKDVLSDPGTSQEQKDAILKEARKGFAADALLGNWDSVGLSMDNMLVTPDGKVVRIDNGGSLRYRAQGALKSPGMFGSGVGELESLRNPNINPSAANVFKGLTPDEVKQQIQDVLNKKEALLGSVTGHIKSTLAERLDYLEQYVGDSPKPADPLFTGIDALGRKWVNGKLVAAEEEVKPVEKPKVEETSKVTNPFEKGSKQASAFDTIVNLMDDVNNGKIAPYEVDDFVSKLAVVVGGSKKTEVMKALKSAGVVPENWKEEYWADFSEEIFKIAEQKHSGKKEEIDEDAIANNPKPTNLPKAGTVPYMGSKFPDATYPAWGKNRALNYDLPDEARPVGLTVGEANALNWYTHHHYAEVNDPLRKGEPLYSDIQNKHEQLQAAFAKTKRMKEPVQVKRGLNFKNREFLKKFVDQFKEHKASNKEITLPGYQSTTTLVDLASFDGNVVLQIEANKGIDVMPISDAETEAELLLDHNSKFEVIEIKEEVYNGYTGKSMHYKIKLRQISE